MKSIVVAVCIFFNWKHFSNSEGQLQKKPVSVNKFMAVLSAMADEERIKDVDINAMRLFYGIFRPFNPSTISYFLWTRTNPTDEHFYKLLWNDENSLTNSPFDGSKKTYFAFHGWTNAGLYRYILDAKTATLAAEDANFISVDWEQLASHRFYFPSALFVYDVAEYTAKLINFLVDKTDLVPANMHIWGHSLGAQCAGITAVLIDGEVDRVTGLDPASPLFSLMPGDHRIDSTNAAFVDIIHTSGKRIPGLYGDPIPRGHVDCYPNGSDPQSGCEENINGALDILSGCSHGMAADFFVESLKRETPFTAYSCVDFKTFASGGCRDGTRNTMGIDANRENPGIYYLFTNPRKPYAQGIL